MNGATLVLVGTILTVLATVLGLVLRQLKRSPEQRTADAAVWTSLSGVNTGLAAEIGRLTQRLADRDVADVERDRKLDQLRRQAEAGERAAREVTWLRGLLLRAVRPIVEWIDAGAHPPPPRIPTDLRTLLDEAEQHERDDPATP